MSRRFDGKDTDDDYMYKFRTKRCTKKRCRNPPKCFDAHSQVMRRRVPKLGKHGLYNYIPEACPQWIRSKKCSMGESCLRSHGWLEIIFHPLLYKTKICKSKLKNGVCRDYGVYCAKAHNPMNIRNLVEIYGENWKRHYDLSSREKFRGSYNIMNSQKKCQADNLPRKRQLIENIFDDNFPDTLKSRRPEQTPARGTAKTSPTFTSSKRCTDPQSPSFSSSSSPLFGNFTSISNRISDLTLDGGVTSYTQLYCGNPEIVKVDDCDLKSSKGSPHKAKRDYTLHSSGIDVLSQESSSASSGYSSFMSPFGEIWKECGSLDGHWKIGVNSSESDNETRPSSVPDINYESENYESLFAQPPMKVLGTIFF